METTKRLLTYFLIATGVLYYLVAGYGFYRSYTSDRVIKFDCTIAEFQPDYPQEVKNECRKLKNATSV